MCHGDNGDEMKASALLLSENREYYTDYNVNEIKIYSHLNNNNNNVAVSCRQMKNVYI